MPLVVFCVCPMSLVYETGGYLCMKQGCGDAAKMERLKFCPSQKMVYQTAYNSVTLLLSVFTQEQKYFPYPLRR